MKSNKIPRNFKCITGKMLISTNANKVNDVFKVYKDDRGYTGINTRTQEKFSLFIAMLRNSEVFELIDIK